MQIVDPKWNLFTSGDQLNAYWFGDHDGTVPYESTNPPIYPSPYIPYDPEISDAPRGVKRRREDDLGLCFEAPQTKILPAPCLQYDPVEVLPPILLATDQDGLGRLSAP